MYTKLSRPKVFRDPLYGYISVEYKIIADLIDAYEVQRLRRIRQLAGISMVFHTAEHSRFSHSLGAYEMAREVILNCDGIKEAMSEYEQLVFLIATLLHDIGHGPFSHAFENVLERDHEEMTVNIILFNGTEINKILSIEKNLASDVASIIAHKGKYPLIESLVSSQLDVDRMDYLQRDSYFTGALYGTIDYKRIIRSMKIVNKEVVFRSSGSHAIESYLMARYHMYWQVYYHNVARSYELLLQSILGRIKELYYKDGFNDVYVESFIKVINNPMDINSYLELDDTYVGAFIKRYRYSDDFILKTLCSSFINRKLFDCVEYEMGASLEEANRISHIYDNNPLYKKYFLHEEELTSSAYSSHEADMSNINTIKILLQSHDVISLEKYSPIIKGLSETTKTSVKRLFFLDVNNE